MTTFLSTFLICSIYLCSLLKRVQFEADETEGVASTVAASGTPVTEFSVTGRACVVLALDGDQGISQLQGGDILIARSTDVGWSPYFPVLGGVVTELGGLISHGNS